MLCTSIFYKEMNMKSILAALALTAAVAIFVSSPVEAWYCKARGTTGAWGWGRSASRGEAQGIALRECAVRTPRGETCLIMYCN
jgi:hypothetical protein